MFGRTLTLISAMCLCGILADSAPAQTRPVPGPGPGPAQGATGSASFRNDLKVPVIIQGISQVNGVLKRGQPLVVAPGKTTGDFNVPVGVRAYSVYDANQPTRVLVKDAPINIVAGRTQPFVVRSLPNGQTTIGPDSK